MDNAWFDRAIDLDTTAACPDVDYSSSYSYQSGLVVVGLQ
jgi:hypothetical protein